MTDRITDIAQLEAIYGKPGKASLLKVADHLTPLYCKWIMASRFCVVSTVGPDGTDGSPRGDADPVVVAQDTKTLLLPDWRGNNRMDTLRNIVEDGRISLMFFVSGSHNVIRVNGTAIVSIAAELLGQFNQAGRQPRSVVVITVAEVYSQCARALMRAQVWSSTDESADLPSIGALLTEQEAGFDGDAYDAAWAPRAKDTMW